MTEPDPTSTCGDQPSLQHVVAEALELAKLQTELLTQLQEADSRGDDALVRRYYATLDHVMAHVAKTEEIRRNVGTSTEPTDELACGACGALLQPVYEVPSLLGYTCQGCQWTAHDPAAQAAEKLAKAKDAAVDTVSRSIPTLESAMQDLQRRRHAVRDRGLDALRAAYRDLDTVCARIQHAQEEVAHNNPSR